MATAIFVVGCCSRWRLLPSSVARHRPTPSPPPVARTCCRCPTATITRQAGGGSSSVVGRGPRNENDDVVAPAALGRRRPPFAGMDDGRGRAWRQRRFPPSPSPSSSMIMMACAVRALSSSSPSPTLVISPEELEDTILRLSKSMAMGLTSRGYWTNYGAAVLDRDDDDDDDDDDGDDGDGNHRDREDEDEILPPEVVAAIRRQAISLRYDYGRFEQSYSERVDPDTGEIARFDKPGVFACEPDGSDYGAAPDMLHYISSMMRMLPGAINGEVSGLGLRDDEFNAKLAVTGPGGCAYPRHVDNVSPPAGGAMMMTAGGGRTDDDARKLTAILYLNPDWKAGDGGELRLYLNDDRDGGGGDGERFVDLSPAGGRLVLFWSDEIPHEVLPNAPHVVVVVPDGAGGGEVEEDDDHDCDDRRGGGSPFDRYALTIWVPSDVASLGRSFVSTP